MADARLQRGDRGKKAYLSRAGFPWVSDGPDTTCSNRSNHVKMDTTYAQAQRLQTAAQRSCSVAATSRTPSACRKSGLADSTLAQSLNSKSNNKKKRRKQAKNSTHIRLPITNYSYLVRRQVYSCPLCDPQNHFPVRDRH